MWQPKQRPSSVAIQAIQSSALSLTKRGVLLPMKQGRNKAQFRDHSTAETG
jgi:hypothetical protein